MHSGSKLLRVKTEMEESLKSLLRVYNETFFSDGQLELIVAAIREGHAKETVQKARVWYLDDDDVNDVRNHLSHRVPIYYEQPMTSGYPSYSDTRLKETCGYSTAEALEVLSKTPLLTYCFGGPVYNLDDPAKSDAIVHTWGVNLETSTTEHYKIFVKDGFLDEDLYEKQSRRILRCIYGAATTLGYSRLSLPFLGLGQYLQELAPPQRHCARRAFFKALASEASLNPGVTTEVRGMHRDLHAIQPVLNEIGFDDLCATARVIMQNLVDTSGGPTLVVNGADSCAFVGNGGCNDPTLDGFIVSGERLNWRTTVYLHNDFLSKLSRNTAAFVPLPSTDYDDDVDMLGDMMIPPPPPALRRAVTTTTR